MRHPLCIGLVAFTLHMGAADDALAKPVQWSGNGHLYELRYDPQGLSWMQAQLRASLLGCGWYLATITSAAENAFLTRLAGSRPEVFDSDGGHGPWLGAFQKNH